MHLNGIYQSGNRTKKDFKSAAANLVALMDEVGVAKALVMPPPQISGQSRTYTYKDLSGAVRKYKDRLALVSGGGELNPIIMSTDVSAVTSSVQRKFKRKAEQSLKAGAKAFGEMAALHFSLHEGHVFEQAPADHPLFLLLADLAASHDVPIDLHMEAVPQDQALPANLVGVSSANPSFIKATIPAFERLLAYNRSARIVWQHIGWDNTGHLTTTRVRQLLGAHPNLHLAIKVVRQTYEGFRISSNSVVEEQLRVRPEWASVISDYPDRCMIGADEFVGIPGRTSAKGPPSFADTWSVLSQLSADLREKVGGQNAAAVYKLD